MAVNECKSPLMIQGYRMSGPTKANVAANTIERGQATIDQRRGKVIFVDVLSMLLPGAVTNQDAIIGIQMGGDDLLQDIPASMYNPDAYSRAYQLTCVDIEPGQTVNWVYDNSLNANVANATMHLYYENPYLLDDAFLAKFDEKARGLKERVYKFAAAGASKVNNSGKQQLPSAQGDIIGFQLFAENGNAAPADVYKAFVSMTINGELVVDSANLGIGYSATSRPYMRFPCGIPKSGTFNMECDNGDSPTKNIYGVKFFFDQE